MPILSLAAPCQIMSTMATLGRASAATTNTSATAANAPPPKRFSQPRFAVPPSARTH